jgi:hypothetical protein
MADMLQNCKLDLELGTEPGTTVFSTKENKQIRIAAILKHAFVCGGRPHRGSYSGITVPSPYT